MLAFAKPGDLKPTVVRNALRMLLTRHKRVRVRLSVVGTCRHRQPAHRVTFLVLSDSELEAGISLHKQRHATGVTLECLTELSDPHPLQCKVRLPEQ